MNVDRCDMCGQTVTGTGRREPNYAVRVCPECWQASAAGWPPAFEPVLQRGLSTTGCLIPDRTAAGLYPRTYLPPADHQL